MFPLLRSLDSSISVHIPRCICMRLLTDNVTICLLEAHEYIEHLDLSTLT